MATGDPGNDVGHGGVVVDEPEGESATVTSTSTDRLALNAADRCDRCGARAFVRVVLPGGNDLLFCVHHARQHEPRLRELASEYVDQSALATQTGRN